MARNLNLKAGDVLIREGDASKNIYFVVSGILEVKQIKLNEEISLGKVSAGELVGEMSFIDQQRRCATVICLTDSTVTEISEKKFKEYLETAPKWLNALIKTLAARLRTANKKVRI